MIASSSAVAMSGGTAQTLPKFPLTDQVSHTLAEASVPSTPNSELDVACSMSCLLDQFPGIITCANGVPASISHGRKLLGFVERPVDSAVAFGTRITIRGVALKALAPWRM